MFQALTDHERHQFNYLLVGELVIILILQEHSRQDSDPNGPQLIIPWLWCSQAVATFSQSYEWSSMSEEDRKRLQRCLELSGRCPENVTSSNSLPSLFSLANVLRGVLDRSGVVEMAGSTG